MTDWDESVRAEALSEWDARKARYACPSACGWKGWWLRGEKRLCPRCGDFYVEESA